MANLLNKRIAILATKGFEQIEMTSPRQALDDAEAITDLISPASSPIKAWNHTEWGASFEVDVALEDANPEDYDMLVLPGGVMNPDNMRSIPEVQEFVRHFFLNNKPVAAICHAAWTLVDAEVLEGRKLTSYASIRVDLENAGAQWVDEPVVIDANLITSRDPDDLNAFNNAIIEMLRGIVPEKIDYREEELEESKLTDYPSPTEQTKNM